MNSQSEPIFGSMDFNQPISPAWLCTDHTIATNALFYARYWPDRPTWRLCANSNTTNWCGCGSCWNLCPSNNSWGGWFWPSCSYSPWYCRVWTRLSWVSTCSTRSCYPGWICWVFYWANREWLLVRIAIDLASLSWWVFRGGGRRGCGRRFRWWCIAAVFLLLLFLSDPWFWWWVWICCLLGWWWFCYVFWCEWWWCDHVYRWFWICYWRWAVTCCWMSSCLNLKL